MYTNVHNEWCVKRITMGYSWTTTMITQQDNFIYMLNERVKHILYIHNLNTISYNYKTAVIWAATCWDRSKGNVLMFQNVLNTSQKIKQKHNFTILFWVTTRSKNFFLQLLFLLFSKRQHTLHLLLNCQWGNVCISEINRKFIHSWPLHSFYY